MADIIGKSASKFGGVRAGSLWWLAAISSMLKGMVVSLDNRSTGFLLQGWPDFHACQAVCGMAALDFWCMGHQFEADLLEPGLPAD